MLQDLVRLSLLLCALFKHGMLSLLYALYLHPLQQRLDTIEKRLDTLNNLEKKFDKKFASLDSLEEKFDRLVPKSLLRVGEHP